jgi:hypothetical protein
MYRGNLSGPSSNMEAKTAVSLADATTLQLWKSMRGHHLRSHVRPCVCCMAVL